MNVVKTEQQIKLYYGDRISNICCHNDNFIERCNKVIKKRFPK